MSRASSRRCGAPAAQKAVCDSPLLSSVWCSYDWFSEQQWAVSHEVSSLMHVRQQFN